MFQQTIIVGNLGSDPELKYLQSGRAVCNFSVAVNRRWNDANGERHEQTDWYRVAAWGSLGELCNQYLSKGRQVQVVGRVSANAYMNNQGEAAASLELTAQNVLFLGSGNGQRQSEPTGEAVDSKDIPF